MKIETAIKQYRNKLIKKADSKGLYENFGQTEVRKLEDKFIDISDYTTEMNSNRNLINSFDNWCMNYDG